MAVVPPATVPAVGQCRNRPIGAAFVADCF